MSAAKNKTMSETYLENIQLLNKAILSLDKMDSRLNETASISLCLSSLRAHRHYLIDSRKELEKEPIREVGEIPLTYSWWFYPKYGSKLMHIPFILYETTKQFSHWIDAVSDAIDIGLKQQILNFTSEGDFVLILNNNTKSYSVISGRTALGNNGTLPDLHSDGTILPSGDKNYLVKAMQAKWAQITDVIDGPTGFPFILLKPIKKLTFK
jgi:hypothetical protein